MTSPQSSPASSPKGTSRAAKILKRTWVGASLALVLALLLYLAKSSPNGVVVHGIGFILCLGLVFELRQMGVWGSRGACWVGLLAVVSVGIYSAPSLDLLPSGPALQYACMGVMAAAVAIQLGVFLPKERDPAAQAPGVLGLAGLAVWIAAALPALALIQSVWGFGALVSILVLSKIGDIAGYYVGNAIGKSHPFPKISPGKTTAGCVGSLLVGIAAGGLMAWCEYLPAGVGAGFVAGALVNVAAQAGDLLESWVKRRAGVKDSGTWFGPSGGLLDLVDSLLLSVPAAMFLWPSLLATP